MSALGPPWGSAGRGGRYSPVGSDHEGPFRRAPPNPVVLDSEGWAEAFLKALRRAAPTGCVVRRQGVGSRKGRPNDIVCCSLTEAPPRSSGPWRPLGTEAKTPSVVLPLRPPVSPHRLEHAHPTSALSVCSPRPAPSWDACSLPTG